MKARQDRWFGSVHAWVLDIALRLGQGAPEPRRGVFNRRLTQYTGVAIGNSIGIRSWAASYPWKKRAKALT